MKKAVGLYLLFFLCLSNIFAADIPEQSAILPGYDEKSAKARFEDRPLSTEEGIWFCADDGLKVAIENTEPENELNPLYRIVAIEADDTSLDCGSILGYLQKSTDEQILKLWVYSDFNDNVFSHPVEWIAEMKEGNHYMLINKPKIKFRISVNLLRLLPSFTNGINIYPRLEKKEIKPGFRKIFPQAETSKIVYF